MAVFASRRFGGWIVAGLIAIGIAAFLFYPKRSGKNPLSRLPSIPLLSVLTGNATPQPAPASAQSPGPGLTLAELTTADMPAAVTLLKPEPIRFKKGAIFVAKSGAPLFYLSEYLRDAKPGEQFQILDYDPANRHVYLRAREPDGAIVAVNTLDLHGAAQSTETLPANTIVALQGVADGNALVGYHGDRFAVPVDDTDLLTQAAARRAQAQGSPGP